jgi:hypothetical protein
LWFCIEVDSTNMMDIMVINFKLLGLATDTKESTCAPL